MRVHSAVALLTLAFWTEAVSAAVIEKPGPLPAPLPAVPLPAPGPLPFAGPVLWSGLAGTFSPVNPMQKPKPPVPGEDLPMNIFDIDLFGLQAAPSRKP